MESPYWVTKEVQAYLNISRQTIDRWRRTLGFPEPVHNDGHHEAPAGT
jgi:predicted DNA-binding transcriptional regulator AlpA